MRDIVDGTSNTMCVSECGDFFVESNDALTQVNSNHGWTMGTNGGGQTLGNTRAFNLTTIRYPPNTVDNTLPGTGNNNGSNNGIYSAHTGGVQALLCDGSVRFITENVDMLTLRRVASRADKGVIGEF